MLLMLEMLGFLLEIMLKHLTEGKKQIGKTRHGNFKPTNHKDMKMANNVVPPKIAALTMATATLLMEKCSI